MAEELLAKRLLKRVLGAARLSRLIRAGWLVPHSRTPSRVLFRIADVHAALRRLECSPCPPDKLEVLRVRTSERRNGHAYVPKPRAQPPSLGEIELDFSGFGRGLIPTQPRSSISWSY